MRHLALTAIALATLSARAASAGDPPAAQEFVLKKSDHSKSTKPSKIKSTDTEAALKLYVVEKDKEAPIPGIVIAITAPSGKKYYTQETDADGYAELLVPINATYELSYVGLGRREINAKVNVTNEPRQNIKLTMRYKRHEAPTKGFVLDGVNFDSGKADIRPESLTRLDGVVEYMTHKRSARIEIAGHTDNVGNPKTNKDLSLRRAQACRDYLVLRGIDAARIDAVGYGDEKPIAPNTSDEGRQKNRRIEATEL
jgi:outer membrane protein OmpA-like peptidoglycan-associated protein